MKGLVAEAFIVAVTVVSAVIVVSSVMPMVDQAKQKQSLTDAKQVLKSVDSTLSQLVYEAPGSRRSIDVKLPAGRFIFSGTEDKIKIQLPYSLMQIGTTANDENIQIQSGENVRAYDNGTDLVLENSALLFAVKKIGTPSSQAFVNTSGIITLIKNKRAGVEVVPRTGIFINDTNSSSYGYGFTELSNTNEAQTASVRLFMNTSVADYDALFTLSSTADFIDLSIRNVRPK